LKFRSRNLAPQLREETELLPYIASSGFPCLCIFPELREETELLPYIASAGADFCVGPVLLKQRQKKDSPEGVFLTER